MRSKNDSAGAHARCFVSARTQPALDKLSRSGLAEIVGQRRQHYRHLARVRKFVDQLPRPIDHQSAYAQTLRLPDATPDPAARRSGSESPERVFRVRPARSHPSPIDGRCACNSSFSNSPQIRSAGRSSRSIDRQSSTVSGSNIEIKAGGKLRRPQNTQTVFSKSLR